MQRSPMASRVLSRKPASFRVSAWIASCAPDSSHTSRQALMTAGVAPQPSCTLNPMTPARSWSRIDSLDIVAPWPSSPTLTAEPSNASSSEAMCQEPEVTVVALLPSAGPVPPPMSVVTPEPSATSSCSGQMKWTWVSTPPAVRILPLPEMTSVSGPITMSVATG